MNGFLEELGDPHQKPTQEEFVTKRRRIDLFDFLNDIYVHKKNLIVDSHSEKDYTPYLINKGLSMGKDTIMIANCMNGFPFLDKPLQNAFLINIVRPHKRYNKWFKKANNKDLELVKEYYGYNNEKAHHALTILTDKQLNYIKKKLNKGGQR